jgi:hypothetical protein
MTMSDEDYVPPVTCCLSEEHGLGRKRLVQVSMDFGERLQVGYPSCPSFYCNLSLDEAKAFAASLAKQISILEGTD